MEHYGTFSVRLKAMMNRKLFSPMHRLHKRSSLLLTSLRAAAWAGVCLALFILGQPSLMHAADKAPDWMHDAARQTLPTYPAETVAVVLLDECVTTVKDNGEVETLYRRAYKILRPEARDEYGEVTVSFDKDNKLSYLKAWAIPQTGPEYEVNEKEAIIDPRSEALYSDETREKLRIPAVAPGNIVGYEY